ncbi:shufflon system plasmid conjugative transfer pilus tip adhesin PilV [Burkholderia gladioli]|uniref:shufflon system plasmid conjugative transfer pilus tip adhesin PilV n=1 Tax=Burkholderia gladioli TaxID=28095 RepID=UPI00163F75E3
MPPLLGSIFAMLLWLSLSSGLFIWIKRSDDAVKAIAVATQTRVIGSAVARFVRDKGATYAAIATATVPATITISDLRNANYLPLGFATSNLYRQIYQAQILQPQPGQLQTFLLSTGGWPIPAGQLVTIASQSGGNGNLGGFVPYANQAGDTTMRPQFAVGAGGSFHQSLGNYSNPGSGHLAVMINVADTQADNGYLYRVDMSPSRPELNNMQTNLGLTDTTGVAHDINGVATVNAVAGRFSGNVGAAGYDPKEGLPAGLSGGVHTWDVYAEGTVATGNQGQINASMDYQGHVVGQLLALANKASPGTACTNYGAGNTSVSANADGSGQMLSCQLTAQGARWMPIGGPILRYGYFTVADNSFVPAPNCPAGAQQLLQLSLQGFSVNQTATVNAGPATWTGNGWTVHMQDGAGAPLPGTATVGTYCYYST